MRGSRWILVFSLALLGAGPSSPTVFRGEGARMFVQDPLAHKKPGDRCEDAACKSLLEVIDSSKTSLEFAIYGIRKQKIIYDAILRAKARGVNVRGVVDMDASNRTYYDDTVPLMEALGTVRTDYEYDARKKSKERPYDPSFEKCERPVGFEGPLQCLGYDFGDSCIVQATAARKPITFEGAIMHNKYVVVDNSRVWMGSMNLSDSGTGGYNANVVVQVDSPVVAKWYVEEFEQMWRDERFHDDKIATGPKATTLADGTGVEVYFTPQDDPMKKAVRPLLQNAKRSIDIGVFYLTHKHVTKDLLDAHARGVKVRIILDATSVTNEYSKHEILRVAGIPVKIENWGGKMHMKAAVIDGEHLIAGSMNWTSAGEGENDENTMILHNKRMAADWTAAFDKMWTSIPDKWLQGRPDPEGKESGTACTDGSDNDFDNLRDAEDPGCGPNPPPLPPLPPVEVVPKDQGGKLVKGVVTEDGRRYFLTPKDEAYYDAPMDFQAGAQYFCSAEEARASGWAQPRKK